MHNNTFVRGILSCHIAPAYLATIGSKVLQEFKMEVEKIVRAENKVDNWQRE